MSVARGNLAAHPATPPVTVARPATGRAIAALARIESVRLLRNPLTLAATVIYLAPWAYAVAADNASEHYPVLQNADRATQLGALFLLGAAALLGVNLAVLRPARYRTAEQHGVLPVPAWQRAVAHLISLLPLAVLATVLGTARIAVLDRQPGAVGRPNLYEIATGPLVVALMGVIGVLVGIRVPSVAASPVAYAGIAALVGIPAILPVFVSSPWRWMLPIAFEDVNIPSMPHELLGRPAGAHVLFLAGLIVVLAGVTLVGVGARGIGVIAVVMVAALVLVTGLVYQVHPRPAAIDAGRRAATYHPDAMQVCESEDTIQFCAFGEFTPWIGDWNATVRAVLARVPADHQPAPFAVRQRVYLADRVDTGNVPQAPRTWAADDRVAGTPDPIVVDTDWGSDDAVMSLAVQVADRAVAGPPSSSLIIGECGGPAVLALWLGAQSSAAATAGLRARSANGSGSVVLTPAGFATGKAFHHADVMAALAVLGRPTGQVATAVAASWAKLIDPHTTTVEAAGILGVKVSLATPCPR